MRTLLFKPQARTDLLDVWEFISQRSTISANRALEKIESEIRRVQRMPGIGHSREDVSDQSYRFWKVYEYLIVYRFDEREVTIIRLVHGRRNISRVL